MSMPPPPPESSPSYAPTPHARVPNHLIWAITSTVFATMFSMLSCCCLPIGLASGIPAIIFATRVNRLVSFDDLDGARAASDKAKLWSMVTTVLAVVFLGMIVYRAMTADWSSFGDLQQMIEEAEKSRR